VHRQQRRPVRTSDRVLGRSRRRLSTGASTAASPSRPVRPVRLIGANVSVRAEVFDPIDGFHSIDFDDMDMCHRVAALGGPGSIVFNPATVVRHYVPHERTTWSYF